MHPDFDVDNRPSGTDRTGDACVPGLFIADLPAPPSGHSRPDPPPRRPSRENADRSGCRSRPRRPRARRRNIRRTRDGGADPWAAQKVPSDPRPLPASTRDSGRTPPRGGRSRRWRPRRIVARCTVAAAYRAPSPVDSSKPTGSVPPDGWTPRHAGCTTSAGRTRRRHARTSRTGPPRQDRGESGDLIPGPVRGVRRAAGRMARAWQPGSALVRRWRAGGRRRRPCPRSSWSG